MAHNYMKISLNYIHNQRMQLKTMKYHFHPLLPLPLSRFSRVQLLATPWTADHQAPPSMGTRLAKIQKFGRILYWQFWGNRHSHTLPVYKLVQLLQTAQVLCGSHPSFRVYPTEISAQMGITNAILWGGVSNKKRLGKTQVSISRGLNKFWYIHKSKYYANIKKDNAVFCVL